jgi:hypothetical protein
MRSPSSAGTERDHPVTGQVVLYVDDSESGLNFSTQGDSDQVYLAIGYRWKKFGIILNSTIRFGGIFAMIAARPRMVRCIDGVSIAALDIDLALLLSIHVTLSLRLGVKKTPEEVQLEIIALNSKFAEHGIDLQIPGNKDGDTLPAAGKTH